MLHISRLHPLVPQRKLIFLLRSGKFQWHRGCDYCITTWKLVDCNIWLPAALHPTCNIHFPDTTISYSVKSTDLVRCRKFLPNEPTCSCVEALSFIFVDPSLNNVTIFHQFYQEYGIQYATKPMFHQQQRHLTQICHAFYLDYHTSGHPDQLVCGSTAVGVIGKV